MDPYATTTGPARLTTPLDCLRSALTWGRFLNRRVQTMGAVLRADGTPFDPERFFAESNLEACNLYRKDQPRFPKTKPEGKKHSTSGITFVVSEADFRDFTRQIEE